MRAGIIVKVTRADRHRLEAIVSDRSAPQKHVWRANIILATAEGCGTAEIMRRSGKSKPVEKTRPQSSRSGHHLEGAQNTAYDLGASPGRERNHAIVDNYATHKHPKVRQWLARHPRWSIHFTLTSASWLNAEGFFAKLTRRRLKGGVFRSVADQQVAINHFVAETNADPKPFVWTADPKRVLAAVKRGKQALEWLH
jgi:hypothetical protein